MKHRSGKGTLRVRDFPTFRTALQEAGEVLELMDGFIERLQHVRASGRLRVAARGSGIKLREALPAFEEYLRTFPDVTLAEAFALLEADRSAGEKAREKEQLQ